MHGLVRSCSFEIRKQYDARFKTYTASYLRAKNRHPVNATYDVVKQKKMGTKCHKKKSVKLRCRKAWVGVVRRCCVSHMDKSLCGLSRPRMWLRNVQEIHHKDKTIQRMTSLKKRQPYRFSHSCVHDGSEVHAKFRLFLNAIYSAPNKYYYIIE